MQDVQLTVGTKVQQAAESISAASSKLDSQRGGEAPSLQAALALADAVDALQEALAAEAFAALLSLRQQAGQLPGPTTAIKGRSSCKVGPCPCLSSARSRALASLGDPSARVSACLKRCFFSMAVRAGLHQHSQMLGACCFGPHLQQLSEFSCSATTSRQA